MSTVPLVFAIFSGFFIFRDNIPKGWIWMYYISFINYAIAALLINEFEGSTSYTTTAFFCANTGDTCPATFMSGP